MIRTILLATPLFLAACGLSSSSGDAGTSAGDAGKDAGAQVQDAGVPRVTGFSLQGELAFAAASMNTRYGGSGEKLPDGGFDYSITQIVISSAVVDFCTASGNSPAPAGRYLNLSVGRGDDAGIVTPGTYAFTTTSAMSPSGGAGVMMADATGTGDLVLLTGRSAGSVTLEEVSAQFVRGTFDAQLLLTDGGTSPLKGSFAVPPCP